MELEPPYLMLEVKPAPAQSTAIILNSSNISAVNEHVVYCMVKMVTANVIDRN